MIGLLAIAVRWFLTVHLKGIVHPKMTIVSSFIQPQFVPNQYSMFFLMLNTKEDILKIVSNQTVSGAH